MAFRRKSPFLFAWHEHCRFTLLVDGPAFFDEMLAAINAAEKFVLLEFYLIESGLVTTRFIEALIQARQRHVEVYLILDDYGTRNLSDIDKQKLISQGIQLYFYNQVDYRKFYHSLKRDHRKILVIDGDSAFIGGAGLTDEFAPPFDPAAGWHDAMVKAQGPVVEDWIAVFESTWQILTHTLLNLPAYHTRSYHDGQLGRITIAEGPHLQEINRSFIKRVRNAERRVWLTTPYFVAARKIRRALRLAARQGVDVRLLLPGPFSDHPWVSHAARGFYTRLLRNKVRIFEYQPRFPHAKIELCDNWVSIGSSNLDRWNQRWNKDANQEVDDPDFAQQVCDMFLADFDQSVEITLGQWQQRPLLQKLREWLSGRLVMLLDRIGRGYSK